QALAALAHAARHTLLPAAGRMAGACGWRLPTACRHLPAVSLCHGAHGLPGRGQARAAVARRNAVCDRRFADRGEQVCAAVCVCNSGDRELLFCGAGADCRWTRAEERAWRYGVGLYRNRTESFE